MNVYCQRNLSQQGARVAAASCCGCPGFTSLWQSPQNLWSVWTGHFCLPRLSLWKHLPELRTRLPPLTGPRKERWPLRMRRWGTKKICLWSWRRCPSPSDLRRRLALWGGRDRVRIRQGFSGETFKPTGVGFGAHDWLFIEYHSHPFNPGPCRWVISMSQVSLKPLF